MNDLLEWNGTCCTQHGQQMNDSFIDAHKPESKRIPQDQFQHELDYWRAQRILSAMLERGLISREEFREITRLNRKSFIPVLSQIMPDIC